MTTYQWYLKCDTMDPVVFMVLDFGAMNSRTVRPGIYFGPYVFKAKFGNVYLIISTNYFFVHTCGYGVKLFAISLGQITAK